MKKKCLSAAVLVLVTTATFALAQASSITVDVPFAFMVSGKSIPAGTYKLTATNNFGQIRVTSSEGKESAIALVLTRISPRSESEAAAVFDVVGTDHYLAEIYIPGLDGFQVPCAPGNHTHAIVKGKK